MGGKVLDAFVTKVDYTHDHYVETCRKEINTIKSLSNRQVIVISFGKIMDIKTIFNKN